MICGNAKSIHVGDVMFRGACANASISVLRRIHTHIKMSDHRGTVHSQYFQRADNILPNDTYTIGSTSLSICRSSLPRIHRARKVDHRLTGQTVGTHYQSHQSTVFAGRKNVRTPPASSISPAC